MTISPRFALPVALLFIACGGGSGTDDSGTADLAGGDASLDGATSDMAPTDGGPSDMPMTDGGPTCARGYSFCGGACIFTAADSANCGSCGHACAAGEACVSNGCTSTCPSPLTLCGDRCVDVRSDSAHCSACDTPCGAGTGCSDRSCVTSVPIGPGPATCPADRPLEIFTPTGDRCTGSIATVSFTHALCSCHDVGMLSAPALFDAFDSATGPYVPGGLGGSVGADGTVSSSSTFHATGDVRISGAAGFRAGSGRYTLNEALRVGAMFDGTNNVDVDHDGYLGGTIANRGATFGGTIHTPSCAAVPAVVTAAACVDEAVSVPPPCACTPADVLPIGAIVAHYADAANNDDATVGLDPDVLAAPSGPIRLDLPCGRYYLTSLSASRPVTIAAHGHTALFIGGDITVSAALLFALDPGATLDVFVGGRLVDSGSLAIGSPAFPSATRFYVDGPCHHEGAACGGDTECCGGSCTGGTCAPDGMRPLLSGVQLSVPADLNGLFYSANGPVVISAPLEMYGAIFGWSYTASSDTTIHYDLEAVRTGDDCPPDGGTPGCTSCRDCDNQACIGGTCGDCTTDADCCSPLYCVGGRCVPGLI